MSEQEGLIQFDCRYTEAPEFSQEQIAQVNRCREECMKLGVVGITDDGIGFGNVSVLFGEPPGFLITGTQTGGLSVLDGRHYCHIQTFDVPTNRVDCSGPLQPSSEGLTHAAVYQVRPEVRAIVHGHHRRLWEHNLSRLPATSEGAACGTVQLAKEVSETARSCSGPGPHCIVLAGHEDGFLVFGANIYDILEHLKALLDAL